MPNWNEILNEIQATGSTHDVVRRRYLSALHALTGRNVIVYYSGWLQKMNMPGVEINDTDKNGFMSVVYQLDRDRGLDLVLHTPGGDPAATESLVNYLHSMFPDNIRAIVPQLAMSAGTMVACACKEIVMGKHSSLGPIDPDHSVTKTHARHLSAEYCRDIGLKVVALEGNHELQKAVLSLHHSCIHTLGSTPAIKLIENQNGIAFIQSAQKVIVQ